MPTTLDGANLRDCSQLIERSKSPRQRSKEFGLFYCEQRRGRELRQASRHVNGDIVSDIDGPKPESWRDKLWLFMTAAGVVLLVCAALSV